MKNQTDTYCKWIDPRPDRPDSPSLRYTPSWTGYTGFQSNERQGTHTGSLCKYKSYLLKMMNDATIYYTNPFYLFELTKLYISLQMYITILYCLDIFSCVL